MRSQGVWGTCEGGVGSSPPCPQSLYISEVETCWGRRGGVFFVLQETTVKAWLWSSQSYVLTCSILYFDVVNPILWRGESYALTWWMCRFDSHIVTLYRPSSATSPPIKCHIAAHQVPHRRFLHFISGSIYTLSIKLMYKFSYKSV